jgi:4-diphosphocytidyl-2-C-methyl-D-erythritol kinase
MRYWSYMPAVRLPCYAKINLSLCVLGRRADGYHELRTVFQTIALHDTLELETGRGPAGIEFHCDTPEISGPQNLAARAAAAMVEELGWRARIAVRLRKRIPMGAGLGGGSSDAAAALRGILRLARKALPRERLLALAASLGADVPFFLLGGTALGLGTGTEVYPLPPFPVRRVVLIYPGIHVSTAQAYAELDRRSSLTPASETDKIFSFCASVGAYRGHRPGNDFQPVVFSTYPEIARLQKFLSAAGASPALLSGSGSAVFGLFEDRRQAAAVVRGVARRFPQCQVWLTRTLQPRTES